MQFDRLLRRSFPSLSRLTYNPLFKFVVDVADAPLRYAFYETRKLPANHARIRIGVGNRLFNNHIDFIHRATNFWIDVALNQYITANSTILEIGVGCGRFAHILRDFSYYDLSFTGQYIGVDIDEEALAWCRQSFDKRFRFHLSTDPSKSYHRETQRAEFYKIPEPDNSVDFVFSGSLFSHLLEREARNYLTESFRLLRPGGFASHSFFCMDQPPSTIGSRHTFSHKMGNAYVESLQQPEAAVAYSGAFMIDLAKEIGFTSAKIRSHGPQPLLVAQKGS